MELGTNLKTSTALVSIIIPVYNGEQYLCRCLDSVVGQDYPYLDIIVVDDGSTDNSASIIENYLEDRRVKFIKKENSGPSDTRNRGIEVATGEFICFVDADDYLAPGYVSVFINAASEYGWSDLIVTDYLDYSIYCLEGVPVKQMEKEGIYAVNDFIPCLFDGTMGVLWGKLFKTSIIKKEKLLLNPKIRFQEDLVFVFAYLKYCNQVLYKSYYTYHYNRLNEHSLTSKLRPHHAEEFEKVQETLLSLSKDTEIQIRIQQRYSIFYPQYILSLAGQFDFKHFRGYIKKIDYKKYASGYKGKKIYALFFLLIQKDFFIPAYSYVKIINGVRRLRLRSLTI